MKSFLELKNGVTGVQKVSKKSYFYLYTKSKNRIYIFVYLFCFYYQIVLMNIIVEIIGK